MDQADTQISHADWTTCGIPAAPAARVVIQAGCFAGVEGELIKRLGATRALVRLQQGVLLEIDASVLKMLSF